MGGCGRQEKPEVLLRSSKTWSYSHYRDFPRPDYVIENLSYLNFGQQMLRDVAMVLLLLFLLLESKHPKDSSPI